MEYGELAEILVRQAQSADEVTRMTALRWLRAFVIQAKDQLMPYYAVILAAVLPNVSHNNQDICQVAVYTEAQLCLQLPHLWHLTEVILVLSWRSTSYAVHVWLFVCVEVIWQRFQAPHITPGCT